MFSAVAVERSFKIKPSLGAETKIEFETKNPKGSYIYRKIIINIVRPRRGRIIE